MGLSGRALSFSHGVFLSFPECSTARRTDRRKKYDLVFIGCMFCVVITQRQAEGSSPIWNVPGCPVSGRHYGELHADL